MYDLSAYGFKKDPREEGLLEAMHQAIFPYWRLYSVTAGLVFVQAAIFFSAVAHDTSQDTFNRWHS